MHNPHLVLLFVLGTLLITAFAAVIIFSTIVQKQRQVQAQLAQQKISFDYQQALLRSRLEVQESTLAALARELHDGVNTILAGGAMQLQAAMDVMQDANGKAALEEAGQSISEAIGAIRSLSHNMHAGLVSDIGLAEAVRRELERITKRTGIRYSLEIAGRLEPLEDQQMLIFRAAQEALQNILKHAGAKSIRVEIDGRPQQYRLRISDDGSGFDTARLQASSLGLRSMKERISLAKGTMDVSSQPGAGTSITLQIPMDSEIS